MKLKSTRVVPVLGIFLSCLSWTAPAPAKAPAPLRPPAVPLIVHDPYFSCWSFADHLYDGWTKHWTGANHAIAGMIRIDGKPYRFAGCPVPRPEPIEQQSLEVHPTRTVYRFEDAGVELTLTFLTPALPRDLELLARPVTYVLFDVRATDGAEHDVSLYFDVSAEWVTNTDDQQVAWERSKTTEPSLNVMRLGSADQPVLAKDGDNLRIDWGHLYLAVPPADGTRTAVTGADKAREAFAASGASPKSDDTRMPRAANDDWPVMLCTFDLGRVGAEPERRHLILAYDDLYGIEYFGEKLRPYWRRDGMEPAALLATSERDLPELRKRCRTFDADVWRELRQAGGEQYARMCVLAFRQCLGANKLVVDTDGKTPLCFSKECFSNGCIGTVDVNYPSSPFFLHHNPALLEAQLEPIFKYAGTEAWSFPFAPHDVGRYPKANGQVYGGNQLKYQMPVEESGNMLIMTAALCKAEGDARFAKRRWELLSRWAEYLRDQGLDPTNQLCTADMFGHMAHNADLSLKAIIGLGAYAELCKMLDKSDEAAEYRQVAEQYAARWLKMALEPEGHSRLAFDRPGTWGMKHNLVWDRVLNLNLFPHTLGDAETALYLSTQNEFGLACDPRTETSLIDWALWCACLARNSTDFEDLIAPLYRYVDETPSRVPLSDWFFTSTGGRRSFQARSVVGGLYMRLLAPPVDGAKPVPRRPRAPTAVRPKLPPIKPLFDFPVRDTSVCLGGDGNYYLTGTTGHPTWWKTNDGIRVWKSPDLKKWELLGLVWKIDDGTWQKEKRGEHRAVWAPDIHFINGTYWITYCHEFQGNRRDRAPQEHVRQGRRAVRGRPPGRTDHRPDRRFPVPGRRRKGLLRVAERHDRANERRHDRSGRRTAAVETVQLQARRLRRCVFDEERRQVLSHRRGVHRSAVSLHGRRGRERLRSVWAALPGYSPRRAQHVLYRQGRQLVGHLLRG